MKIILRHKTDSLIVGGKVAVDKFKAIEECEQKVYPEKNTCYRVLAYKLADYSLCERVVEQGTAGKDMCYLSVAKMTQDVSICEKIGGPMISFKKQCFDAVRLLKEPLW